MFQLIDNVKCHRESTPNILTSNICQYENMSLKYIQLGTGQFISQLYIYPMPFNSYKLKNIKSKQGKIFLTGKISAIFLNKILDQSNLPLYILFDVFLQLIRICPAHVPGRNWQYAVSVDIMSQDTDRD